MTKYKQSRVKNCFNIIKLKAKVKSLLNFLNFCILLQAYYHFYNLLVIAFSESIKTCFVFSCLFYFHI